MLPAGRSFDGAVSHWKTAGVKRSPPGLDRSRGGAQSRPGGGGAPDLPVAS